MPNRKIPGRRRSDADRRVRQAERLARALRLLQLIQGRGRWNQEELAKELGCSERTIFRDLKVLEFAGIPWQFDGDSKCYRVPQDHRFPQLNFSPDELLGLATAVSIAGAVGLNIGRGATPAANKLCSILSDQAVQILKDAERFTCVLDLKLADHSRHRQILRTAQWGVVLRHQLAGRYQSPYQDEVVKLVLHPYRLCLVKQAWYLIARASEETEPKAYRIARFASLKSKNQPAELPDQFDLRKFFGNAWGVYRGDTSYDVEIEFTKEAAPLVTETIWHPTQQVKRQRSGAVTLSFTVDGLDEIVWWVLGWTGRATVKQPDALRQLVVQQLQAGLQLHCPPQA